MYRSSIYFAFLYFNLLYTSTASKNLNDFLVEILYSHANKDLLTLTLRKRELLKIWHRL